MPHACIKICFQTFADATCRACSENVISASREVIETSAPRPANPSVKARRKLHKLFALTDHITLGCARRTPPRTHKQLTHISDRTDHTRHAPHGEETRAHTPQASPLTVTLSHSRDVRLLAQRSSTDSNACLQRASRAALTHAPNPECTKGGPRRWRGARGAGVASRDYWAGLGAVTRMDSMSAFVS